MKLTVVQMLFALSAVNFVIFRPRATILLNLNLNLNHDVMQPTNNQPVDAE